jgi:16S rRNA C1402 N4-methylase RsmH
MNVNYAKPITASAEEIGRNPRARQRKLRVGERAGIDSIRVIKRQT